jgi:plastocyanin domain-containing protein
MLWINLAGVALIGLIVWWFWIYQSASVAMQDGAIEILVKDGVYQPSKK